MECILVVEDERKISDLVRDYLTSQGFSVIQAFDGLKAVEQATGGGVALVVLDLMLPFLDGMQVARRIRDKSMVPIIMLTAREAEADKLLGLEVGADDYMTKPFSVRELGARVRAVLRRSQVATAREGGGEVVACAGIELDPVRYEARRHGVPFSLTSAQFALLLVMLREPGRVFSRNDLMEKTSGYEYEGYERTIDVQVKNIRKVIEDDPANPQVLVTVRGVGYKIQEAR